MIIYKTQNEIEVMAEGGKILAQVLHEVAAAVKPGIGTKDLNDLAERLIIQKGALPSFKHYKAYDGDAPFPTALCASINQEVVHAPAIPNRLLKEGDIIGLDLGVKYKNYFTDMALTVAVGKISKSAQKLLTVTQEALYLGIDQVKEGNHLSDIAKAVQNHVEKNGFSVVRELVGHGVGKKVHEKPNVPNFLTEESKQVPLKRGLTIAVEPMVNMGDWPVDLLEDGFSFVARDGSLSAQFEHTVCIDHTGQTKILTEY